MNEDIKKAVQELEEIWLEPTAVPEYLKYFLKRKLKAIYQKARICPRHHENLRCLGCLYELKAIESSKEK